MAGRPGALSLGTDGAHQRARPPQVEELFEGYCLQCRLRDGASNMQRAFSRCPPSRASRESLQELGRSLQECTEVGGQWGPWRAAWGGRWNPRKHPSLPPGPLAGRICVPPPPTSPSPGLGGEPPCVGLCRTCGSSRGPWRFTWESSTSG